MHTGVIKKAMKFFVAIKCPVEAKAANAQAGSYLRYEIFFLPIVHEKTSLPVKSTNEAIKQWSSFFVKSEGANKKFQSPASGLGPRLRLGP